MFNWKVVRKNEVPSDRVLEQIKDILFPSPKIEEDMDNNGQIVKVYYDRSIDTNLDAVVMDLTDDVCNEVTLKTINNSINRLVRIKELLNVHYMVNTNEAQYLVVQPDERFDKKVESEG